LSRRRKRSAIRDQQSGSEEEARERQWEARIGENPRPERMRGTRYVGPKGPTPVAHTESGAKSKSKSAVLDEEIQGEEEEAQEEEESAPGKSSAGELDGGAIESGGNEAEA
jgi:hypothetical protein